MFSRILIDDSGSINDTIRVIRMLIVSDGVILTTLELSFFIFIIQVSEQKGLSILSRASLIFADETRTTLRFGHFKVLLPYLKILD